MKKTFKILIILILFTSGTILPEKTYADGWKVGYKAGYCFEVVGCIKPIPPVAPIAKIGFDKYQDGYNRGFTKGKSDNK